MSLVPRLPDSSPTGPEVFRRAAASLSGVRLRPEVIVREAPAPARLAPFAHACSVELGEHASGRLVYLHDPAGQPAWAGRDRLVAFGRTAVEPAMATDPLLADVVWTWLTDALAASGAMHSALGGTVTTTASHRYGSLAHVEAVHEVELRCSWTPLAGPRRMSGRAGPAPGPDLAPHLAALVATLAGMCGLPPEERDLLAGPRL